MSFKGAWSVVKSSGFRECVLSGLLMATATAEAGTLDASWIAPTTNTDGSPLTDLAAYRLYYGMSGSPCPSSSVVQVTSPTSSPSPGQVMSYRLSGLTAGTLYYVSVSAVDTSGNPSNCSLVASAVARSDFGVSPTGTVNFGSVNVGSFVDRTFTVTNTGGGTISGTASVASPFSVVSGSPFSLTVGATQTVTVRFAPTSGMTASANLTFAASGSSLSTVVTGGGIATDTTPPVVSITSPTSSSTYNIGSSSITLGGTSSDNIGVTQVTWANDRGGTGTASGISSWSATGIALQPGSNKLTVAARDAAGNTRTASLTVTLGDTIPPTVALTTPTSGATVAGTMTVSATATDNVGVVGVQFKLDGANLGAEVTSQPYAMTWNTTTAASGGHVLAAVARDAAGNVGTSPGTPVTVAPTAGGSTDVTAPTISKMNLSVRSSDATIGWMTNEASDTQLDYGPTEACGSQTALNMSLVTSHSQDIRGLEPNTWYFFRARSRDAAGNIAVSKTFKFKTRGR